MESDNPDVWTVVHIIENSTRYELQRNDFGDFRGICMKALTIWITYIWAKTLAGLAIHPYQSVKRMVFGEKILLPVTLSPLIGLITLFVIGRVGSYFFTLGNLGRELVALVLGSILIGLILWQVLLLALVYRFWRAR